MKIKLKLFPVSSAVLNKMRIKRKNRLDSLLIIGSTSRKAGKTTLVCRIIEKFKYKNIIAIKITTLRKGDKIFHREKITNSKGFIIKPEGPRDANKDTSRFLATGAQKAFWLIAKSECLENGINSLFEKMPGKAVLICETNSLRQIIKPAVFIMVKGKGKIKPSASKILRYADVIIKNNEVDDFLKNLKIISGKWMIKKSKRSP